MNSHVLKPFLMKAVRFIEYGLSAYELYLDDNSESELLIWTWIMLYSFLKKKNWTCEKYSET